MNKYVTLIVFPLLFLLIGCNTKTGTEENNLEIISADTIKEENETIIEEKEIVGEPEKEKTPLEHHITYLKEAWKDAPNPIIATYDGAEMGDYLHFGFMDDKERYYDFADGNNDLGDFELLIDGMDSNEKYVGKKFEIKWAWKMSKFPCCDGEMNTVETEVPSIVGIKLLE